MSNSANSVNYHGRHKKICNIQAVAQKTQKAKIISKKAYLAAVKARIKAGKYHVSSEELANHILLMDHMAKDV